LDLEILGKHIVEVSSELFQGPLARNIDKKSMLYLQLHRTPTKEVIMFAYCKLQGLGKYYINTKTSGCEYLFKTGIVTCYYFYPLCY
jgi:hypothetical protein